MVIEAEPGELLRERGGDLERLTATQI